MEKSALFMACRPSWPAMPTPTCASWIIGTSLAPSPMASVTGVGFTPSRTMRTNCAFCSGDTRHAMTMEQMAATFKNSSFSPPGFVSASTYSSAKPVISMATFLPLFSASYIPGVSLSKSLLTCVSSWDVLSIVTIFISSVRTFELKPMLRAVSSLSPVRTHSLMSAWRMSVIVCGTSSCSLSSMAVAPTTVMPTSISSAALARASSRFCKVRSAALYVLSHSLTVSASSSFRAITKVRKPSCANCDRCCVSLWGWFGDRLLSIITLSAPLHKRRYFSLNLTTTDMRFRVESNWFVARTEYSCVSSLV
mmetsp:Transcript_100683/g.280419  ORF Transcript_100683/g.280419 Transcript_100683/m.280419 type:complete len:308 (+) Transcript_100683:1905-2828(+)